MTLSADHEAETQPLFADLQVWHAFLLRKAGQRVAEQAETGLVSLNMTLRQFGVLNVLAAEPGLNQRAVGAKLRIDRTTIVALVDGLEAAGLVERRRGADRRTFALYLSEAGQDALEKSRVVMAQVHDEFLAPLSSAERELLRELLIRLVAGGDEVTAPV